MGRPKAIERDQIVREVMSGATTKEIAYKLNRTQGGISKIMSNIGIRKYYLTETEFARILTQRKATQ